MNYAAELRSGTSHLFHLKHKLFSNIVTIPLTKLWKSALAKFYLLF